MISKFNLLGKITNAVNTGLVERGVEPACVFLNPPAYFTLVYEASCYPGMKDKTAEELRVKKIGNLSIFLFDIVGHDGDEPKFILGYTSKAAGL